MSMNQSILPLLLNKDKIKRSSKIPSALKNQFLIALVSEDITIKDAARRFNINYSTAKAIVKENKKFLQERSTKSDDEYVPGINILEHKVKEENSIKGPECGYELIGPKNSSEQAVKKTQIFIVSTVAWDFLSNGLL